MHTEQVEALRDAAADGVVLDGLEAERESDAYRFAVGDETCSVCIREP